MSAREIATIEGLPGYPFVVIPHPIAGNTDEELRAKAEQARGDVALVVERELDGDDRQVVGRRRRRVSGRPFPPVGPYHRQCVLPVDEEAHERDDVKPGRDQVEFIHGRRSGMQSVDHDALLHVIVRSTSSGQPPTAPGE